MDAGKELPVKVDAVGVGSPNGRHRPEQLLRAKFGNCFSACWLLALLAGSLGAGFQIVL